MAAIFPAHAGGDAGRGFFKQIVEFLATGQGFDQPIHVDFTLQGGVGGVRGQVGEELRGQQVGLQGQDLDDPAIGQGHFHLAAPRCNDCFTGSQGITQVESACRAILGAGEGLAFKPCDGRE